MKNSQTTFVFSDNVVTPEIHHYTDLSHRNCCQVFAPKTDRNVYSRSTTINVWVLANQTPSGNWGWLAKANELGRSPRWFGLVVEYEPVCLATFETREAAREMARKWNDEIRKHPYHVANPETLQFALVRPMKAAFTNVLTLTTAD